MYRKSSLINLRSKRSANKLLKAFQLLIVTGVLALVGCSSGGSSNKATLSGTATYSSGASASGVLLTIRSSDSSSSFDVTVNSSGEFSVSFGKNDVADGNFSITAADATLLSPVGFFYSGSSVSGIDVKFLTPTTADNTGRRGLAGVIIDATNNQPLDVATVTIGGAVNTNGGLISTVTDATGAYYFDNLPSGEHTVVVTKEGYTAAYGRLLTESRTVNAFVFSNPATDDLQALLDDLLATIVDDGNYVEINNDSNSGGDVNVDVIIEDDESDGCNCTISTYITDLLRNLPISEDKFGTMSFVLAPNNGVVQGKVDLDMGGTHQAVEGAQVLVYRVEEWNAINIDNVNLNDSSLANFIDPTGGTVQVITPSSGDAVENTSSIELGSGDLVLVGTTVTDVDGRYSVPATAGFQYHVEVLVNSDDPFGGIADQDNYYVTPGDDTGHLNFVLTDDVRPYVTQVELEDVVAADGTLRMVMDEGQFQLPDTITGFSGSITISFNEPMLGSSLSTDQIDLIALDHTVNTAHDIDAFLSDPNPGNIVSFSANWSADKTQLIITPHAQLLPDVVYALNLIHEGSALPGSTIASLLRDQSGNVYDGTKDRRESTIAGQINNAATQLPDALGAATGTGLVGVFDFAITRENPQILTLADGDVVAPMCEANSGSGDFEIEWPQASVNGFPAIEYRIYATTGSPVRKVQIGRVEGTIKTTYEFEGTLGAIDLALGSADLPTINDIYGANDFSEHEMIQVGVAAVSESGVVGPTSWVMVMDNSGPELEDVASSLSASGTGVSFYEEGDPLPGGLVAWEDGVYVETQLLGDGTGIFRFQEDIVLPAVGTGIDFQNGTLITRDGDYAFGPTNTDEGLIPVTITNSANNDRVARFDIPNPELIDTGDHMLVTLLDEHGNTTCTPIYFVDNRAPEIASMTIDPVSGVVTVTLNEPVFGATVDADDFTFTEFVDYNENGELDGGEPSEARPVTDDEFFVDIESFDPGVGSQTAFTFMIDPEELSSSLQVVFNLGNLVTDLGYIDNVATVSDDRVVADDPIAPRVEYVELFHDDSDLNNDGIMGMEEGPVGPDDLWKTAHLLLSEDLDLEGDADADIFDYQAATYTFVINGFTYVANWVDGGDGEFQGDESLLLDAKPSIITDSDDDQWIKLVFKDENFFTQVLSNTDSVTISGISDFGGNAVDATPYALTDHVPPKLIDIAASEGPADEYDVITLTISEELSASATARLTDPTLFHVEIDGVEMFIIGTPVVTLNGDGTTTVVLNVPEDELVDDNGNLVADISVEIFDGTLPADIADFYVLEDVADNRRGGEEDSPDVVAAADAEIGVLTMGVGVTDPLSMVVSIKSGFSGELELQVNFGEPVATNQVTDPANWTFPAGVAIAEFETGDADPQFTTLLVLDIEVDELSPTADGQSFTLAGAAIIDEAGNNRSGDNLSISVVADVYDITGPVITLITLGDGDAELGGGESLDGIDNTPTHDVLILSISDNIGSPALAVDGADEFDTSELESDSFDVSMVGTTATQVSAPLYDPVAETITIFLADGDIAALRDGSGDSDLLVETFNFGLAGSSQLTDNAGNQLRTMYPRGNTGQYLDNAGNLVDVDGNYVDVDGEFLDTGVAPGVDGSPFLSEDPFLSSDLDLVASFTVDLEPFVSPVIDAHNFNTALNGSLFDGDLRVTQVQIYFSKEMDENSVEDPSNYTLPTGFTLFNSVDPQYEELTTVSTNVADDGVTVDLDGEDAMAGDFRVTMWLSSTLNLLDTDTIAFADTLVDVFNNPIVQADISGSDRLGPIFVNGSFVFTADISFDDLMGVFDPLNPPAQIDRIEFSVNEDLDTPLDDDAFGVFILTDNEGDEDDLFDIVDADDFVADPDADFRFDDTFGFVPNPGGTNTFVSVNDLILDIQVSGGTGVTLFIQDELDPGNTLTELAFNQRLVILPKLNTVEDESDADNVMDIEFAAMQNLGADGSAETLATVIIHTFDVGTLVEDLPPGESQLLSFFIDFDQKGIISADTEEWDDAMQDAANYSFTTADDDIITLLVTPQLDAGDDTIVELLAMVTVGATGDGIINIGDALTLGSDITDFLLDPVVDGVLIPLDFDDPALLDPAVVNILTLDGTIEITVSYNKAIEDVSSFGVGVEVDLNEFGGQVEFRTIVLPVIGIPEIDNVNLEMTIAIPNLVVAEFGPAGDAFNQTIDIASLLDTTGDNDGFTEVITVKVNGLVALDGTDNGGLETTATRIFPVDTGGPFITDVSVTMLNAVFDDDIAFNGAVSVVGVAPGGWITFNGDRRADNLIDEDLDGVVNNIEENPDGIDNDGDGAIDDSALDALGSPEGPAGSPLLIDGLDNDGDGVFDDDDTVPAGIPEVELDGVDSDGAWLIVQDITVEAVNGFTETEIAAFEDWDNYFVSINSDVGNDVDKFGSPAAFIDPLDPTMMRVRLFFSFDEDVILETSVGVFPAPTLSDFVRLEGTIVDATGLAMQDGSDTFHANGTID
ncbi:MAG: hypothetical protein ACI845_000848 [Gammaproteobacteria bacterium]|jgi:hypothetical protein